MRKFLSGWLAGIVLTAVMVTGVGAIDAENPGVVATTPRDSRFSDRFLISEIKLSGDKASQYITIQLNDEAEISPRVYEIWVDNLDEDGNRVDILKTKTEVDVTFEGVTISGADSRWIVSDMGYGDEMRSLLVTIQERIRGGQAWSDRVLDLNSCIDVFEEGVVCRLEVGENGTFYYGGWKDGVKIEKNEPVVEPTEVEDEDGMVDKGAETGVVTEPVDQETNKNVAKSVPKRITNVAIMQGNSVSDSEKDTEEEDGTVLLATNDEADEGETDIVLPPVGRVSGMDAGLLWVLWIIAVLMFAFWIILLAKRRKKETENEKAIENIVAGSKK